MTNLTETDNGVEILQEEPHQQKGLQPKIAKKRQSKPESKSKPTTREVGVGEDMTVAPIKSTRSRVRVVSIEVGVAPRVKPSIEPKSELKSTSTEAEIRKTSSSDMSQKQSDETQRQKPDPVQEPSELLTSQSRTTRKTQSKSTVQPKIPSNQSTLSNQISISDRDALAQKPILSPVSEVEAEKQRKELAKAEQNLREIWQMIFSRCLPVNITYDPTDLNSVLKILNEHGQKLRLNIERVNMIKSKLLKAYSPIFQNPQSSESDKSSAKEEIRKLSDVVLKSPLIDFYDERFFSQSIIKEAYAPILKNPQSSESDKSYAKEEIRKLLDMVLESIFVNLSEKQSFAQFIIIEAYAPILKDPHSSESDKSFAVEEVRKLSDMVLNNQEIDFYDKIRFAQSIIREAYAPILKDPQSSESDKSSAKEEIRKLSNMVLKSPLIDSINKQSFAQSVMTEAYAPVLKDPQFLKSDKSSAREEIGKLLGIVLENPLVDSNDKQVLTQSTITEAYTPILRDPQSSESDRSFIREEIIRLLNILSKAFIANNIKLDLITDMMNDYATVLQNPTSQDSKTLLSKYGEGGMEAMDALMQKYPDFVKYYKLRYTVPVILDHHFTNIMTARPAPATGPMVKEEPYKEPAPITSVSHDLLEAGDESLGDDSSSYVSDRPFMNLYKKESSIVGEEEPYEELRPIALEPNSIAKTAIESISDGASYEKELSAEAESSSSSIILDPDSESVPSQSSRSSSVRSSRSTETGISR